MDSYNDTGIRSIKATANSPMAIKMRIAEYVMREETDSNYFNVGVLDSETGEITELDADDLFKKESK